MYYYSINSNDKMFHSEGCGHMKTIRKENLRAFDSMERAHRAQYKYCPCCSPVGKRLKKELDDVKAFCKKKGFVCFTYEDNLHIYTNRNHWQVVTSEDREHMDLHKRSASGIQNASYCLQDFRADTIMEYAEHIAEADRFRLEDYIVA